MSQPAPQFSSASVGATLREGVQKLERASVPSAPLAAELILMHALTCDRTFLYAHPEAEIGSAQLEKFNSLVNKRAAGTPTQYLTGHQEFWGLDFEVTPDVLIPRPESEHLIEVALARIGQSRRNNPLRIADVGTGSGCIAVALAKEFPNANIFATDISSAALKIAERNATRHNFKNRIAFAECNLLEGIPPQPPLNIVVSNPPYVARKDAASLPIDVREHEPELALFGGEDGMEIYPRLIAQAKTHLAEGGLLVLELGVGLFEPVSDLLEARSGWTRVSATQDLAGIVRVISAIRI
ncbi:MAG TPA: peptide chain release factor N(5)-glutamine methyltransferase [Candidatus Acidoferrales bacterium]